MKHTRFALRPVVRKKKTPKTAKITTVRPWYAADVWAFVLYGYTVREHIEMEYLWISVHYTVPPLNIEKNIYISFG